jgi:hypothetical protein
MNMGALMAYVKVDADLKSQYFGNLGLLIPGCNNLDSNQFNYNIEHRRNLMQWNKFGNGSKIISCLVGTAFCRVYLSFHRDVFIFYS